MATEGQEGAAGAGDAAITQIAEGLTGNHAANPAPPPAAAGTGSKPPAAAPPPATPQPETKKTDDALTEADRLRLQVLKMEEKMRAMEEKQTAIERSDKQTSERRAAEDALTQFIRETNGIPLEMLREVMKPSTDRKELLKQFNRIGEWAKEIIDSEVRRGRLRYVNIGGSSGGVPIGDLPMRPSQDAVSQIAVGLRTGAAQPAKDDVPGQRWGA